MVLAAPTLPQTVRAAAHRALAARERLVRESPQWEAWRRRIRAAKTQAIARLDELLAQLQENVEAWGGTVLFAEDAAAARKLILDIARRHGVEKVVKSKSMTTEEIALNPHLIRAGLDVVETDLGEFIIQLAGHPPAHLTAPALHLNRGQIADIFAENLNLACPPDPVALCQAASRYLKDRFRAAHLGVTGVNFAAAAEGTLVFLENESNLRQSLALPKVHVALMGLEKVIPSLAELEPFLRLLPASATGQRSTALVHFLNGLKSRPEGGPQSFYLLILDNGRRRLAARPELREALYCLRCGACLNICPVFQAGAAHLYGRVYPGAIGILLARYLAPLGDISDLCTQCGACGDICPAAIELPEKILAVRQDSPRFRNLQRLSRMAGLILAHPRLYRGLETARRVVPGKFLRLPVKKLLGAGLSSESFHRCPSEFQDVARPALRAPANVRPAAEEPPLPAAPLTPSPPGDRFQEANAKLVAAQGPEALARLLASDCQGEVWLEDHPLSGPAARELAQLGLRAQVARDSWPGEVDTAITVGLGAIPEVGSVLMGPKPWPAAWLPFRARRQVVLIPPERAELSFADALAFTSEQAPGLVTWLTGPTRTTDIEKVLVLGAQGPAALDVVIYSPED
jgi:L-lactate dehydrogenase complex protein LldF